MINAIKTILNKIFIQQTSKFDDGYLYAEEELRLAKNKTTTIRRLESHVETSKMFDPEGTNTDFDNGIIAYLRDYNERNVQS